MPLDRISIFTQLRADIFLIHERGGASFSLGGERMERMVWVVYSISVIFSFEPDPGIQDVSYFLHFSLYPTFM